MITFSLQSGSHGNAIYVEAGDQRLLFDAGISGRSAERRMAAHGRDIRDCNALIISHDHRDHASCAGIYQRKFGMPIHVSKRVWSAVGRHLGPVHDVRRYTPGDTLVFDDVAVHTVLSPHDGIDTVCFIIEHDGRRLAILTDLGHPFARLESILGEVDAAYLESNYEAAILEDGPYPERLKRRIAGDGGHLSNDEAAMLVDRAAGPRLQWVAMSHLSQDNNRPELALEAHRRRIGSSFPVRLAPRYSESELFEVSRAG